MSDKTIQYLILNQKNDLRDYLSGILRLYHQEKWFISIDTEEEIQSLISGSFCFIAVLKDDQIIGSGRALADGVSDAYLHNIVVDKNYRKLGIGQEIVKHLVEYCFSHHINWIGLIAEPGTHLFYEKVGFQILPNETPMVLKKRE